MDNIIDTLVEIPQKKKWPDCRSMVNVIFLDGEIREYEISASSHLSRYLVEQASETGILCFIDKRQKASLSIPVANIREWSLKEIEEAPAKPAPEAAQGDALSAEIMDAMEAKPLALLDTQFLKTKATNIVESELRRHGSAAVLKRSKRDWMRVDRIGKDTAMFIRSALFDLRKQNR